MTTDESYPPGIPEAPLRPRRLRNLLLTVAGFVSLLAIIASGTFIYFYDRATAIDRSTPQVAVSQFLDATLRQRDIGKVSLFVCRAWSAEQAVSAAEPPTDNDVTISWGDTSVQVKDDDTATAQVRVEFIVSAGSLSSRSVRLWTLGLVNEDGWRVCSLTKRLLDP